jgi:hypothetical protein
MVHTEPTLGRCDLLKHILEAHGIECFIKNEQGSLTAGAGWGVPGNPSLPFSWPEIWIYDDDKLEEAKALLRDSDQDWRTSTGSWPHL